LPARFKRDSTLKQHQQMAHDLEAKANTASR
jgi:hypothetical protein